MVEVDGGVLIGFCHPPPSTATFLAFVFWYSLRREELRERSGGVAREEGPTAEGEVSSFSLDCRLVFLLFLSDRVIGRGECV